MDKSCPIISKELVEFLQALYRDELPEFGTPQEEIVRRQGQQEVVKMLKRKYEEQYAYR
jgi:hypothetical protein